MAEAIENKDRSSLFEYGWALRYGVAPMMVALGKFSQSAPCSRPS